jgi:SAM-dependent methyltransferase
MPDAAPPSPVLADTGERMIPTAEGEVSVVFASHRFAYDFARGFAGGKDVLDVGCGTGYGTAMLADVARHAVGLDRDAEAVAYCRAHYAAPNLDFRVMDATALPELAERFPWGPPDGRFDLAVSFQVIEHLADPGRFLDDLRALVRPGGTILLTTPNVRRPPEARGANPFHCSEMSHDELRALLASRFADFDLLGVDFARPNALRALAEKLPFYQWLGRRLRRGSAIKKAATRAMGLTAFRVIREHVARDATDLLAVCHV